VKNNLRNKLVSLYDDQDTYIKLYANMRSRLLKLNYYLDFLPSHGLIVDVGCGYGILANYLSLCCPDNTVLGIDLDRKRINAATKTIGKRENIFFAAVDATQWDWPSCTGIAMTSFLHHIKTDDQEIVLQKAFQSLEKGGILLILEVNKNEKPLYRYWASYLSDRILYPLSTSYFRESSNWYNILTHLGFHVRTEKLNNPIFSGVLFICQRKEV
jgi:ubiquinone/menaquinone biosynthesis C-methylase UbiE